MVISKRSVPPRFPKDICRLHWLSTRSRGIGEAYGMLSLIKSVEAGGGNLALGDVAIDAT